MAEYGTTARVDLSSAGVKVGYKISKDRPTSGWVALAGIKSIPSMNEQPETIDATTLDELEARRIIKGLKAAPSATNFTANLSNVLTKQWREIISDLKEAQESDSDTQLWIVVAIPRYDFGFYFSADPSNLDMPAITVGSVIEIDLYITPTSDRYIDTAPTDIAAYTPKSSYSAPKGGSLSGD